MARPAAGLSPARTGPALPRPVVLCGLLALAGHAWLLGARQDGLAASAAHGVTTTERLLHVNLVQPAPAAPSAGPAAAAATVDEPTTAAPAASAPRRLAPAPASLPPQFAQELPELQFPDAALPDTGVQLRVWVRVGGDGEVLEMASALLPADAPAAFAKLGTKTVADARFTPGEPGRTHCLQVDFKADAEAPRWSWRRDGADRCLTNPSDEAQALTPAP
ncbi:MAG: hypothetical protein ACK44A_06765 [Roseateles sp.]